MRHSDRNAPTNPPTIGHLLSIGMTGFDVTCINLDCRHGARLAFADLKLDPATIFLDIPRARAFRCSRCGWRGRRKVEVFPDWSTVKSRGNGRKAL